MIAAPLLRLLAYAIALGAIVDPAVDLERATMPKMTVAVVTAARAETNATFASRFESGMRSAERLRQLLEDRVSAEVRLVSAEERASACRDDAACVLITDGVLPAHVLGGSSTLLGMVAGEPVARSGVEITSVHAPARQNLHSAGKLLVELTSAPDADDARLTLLDSGVPVGDVSVRQTRSTGGGSGVAMEWVPLGPGVRHLQLHATSADALEAIEGAVDIGVSVHSTPDPVLIYDPRPSWSSTFVRRALEQSPSFAIRARTRVAPGVVASAGETFALRPADLLAASVVIVGAPEELTVPEVELLRRYVQERGGSLLVLPDRASLGRSATLWPAVVRERVVKTPLQAGPMRASELLLMPSLPVGTRSVVTIADGTAVVATAATGGGRIIFSGMLDAWRYRAEDAGAFDRFWQGVVAEAASAAGPPLAATVENPLVSVGEDVLIHIERRSFGTAPLTAIRATVACDTGVERSSRVWPDGVDRFVTRFTPEHAGMCRVTVEAESRDLGAQTAIVEVRAIAERRRPRVTGAALSRLAALHDAAVVAPGEEDALVKALLARLEPGARVKTPVQPMRSPWWLLPFVTCLTGEWWLRRRRGLR